MKKTEIIKLNTCVSTNDEALKYAVPDKIIAVSAKNQTGGRGRVGRSFISDEGGMYLSIATEMSELIPCITQLTGVIVSDAIKKICGIDTQIKWPNDILYEGKKLCGILCELRVKDNKSYLIIGIGVNVNNDIPDNLPEAVSIKQILSYDADLRGIVDEIINDMGKLLNGLKNTDFMLTEYKAFCVNLGKTVRASYEGRAVEGTAIDISPSGGLILDTPEGKIEITYGEAIIK